MPITQTRMLSLIAAADDLRQAIESAEAQAKSCLAIAQRSGQYQRELETLTRNISIHFLLLDPINTISTLAVEKRHFAINKSRNESAARWHAQQRQGVAGGISRPRGQHADEGQRGGQHQHQQQPFHSPVEKLQPAAIPLPAVTAAASPEPEEYDPTYDTDKVFASLDLPLDLGDSSPLPLPPPPVASTTQLTIEVRASNSVWQGSGHFGKVIAGASAEEDRLACDCGFAGSAGEWRRHLAEAEATEASASAGAPKD